MSRHLDGLMRELPEGIDAALITSPVNRRYYTGLQSSAGMLLVTRGSAELIIDFRYIETARAAADGYEVLLSGSLGNQLKERLAAHKARCIGVETGYMTLSEFQRLQQMLDGVTLSDDGVLNAVILCQRSVKSREEYEIMQRAQNIADRCLTEICNFIRPGVTERAVANELSRLLKEYGASREAFDTIVVAGPNSSKPHGVPGERPIGDGELLTVDFGVKLDGYCSDTTRTFGIGRVSDEMRAVYETVLAAQKAALSAIEIGMECRAVDAVARDLIDAAGYRGCFGHGLGHSLGLEIHEAPAFSPRDSSLVRPGLVMSVEPGIYLEGRFGCRIEDVVYITETGIIDLTGLPKELTELR